MARTIETIKNQHSTSREAHEERKLASALEKIINDLELATGKKSNNIKDKSISEALEYAKSLVKVKMGSKN